MSSEPEATPWKVFGPYGGHHFFVERERHRSIHCKSLEEALKTADELNKSEAQRQAELHSEGE